MNRSRINFDFVTTLGDKLDALRTSSRYTKYDDNIHSVWSPGRNLFERLGVDVFEIDAKPSSKDEQKRGAARENGKIGETAAIRETSETRGTSEKTLKTPTRPMIEDQREIELSEALRWTVSVTTAR
jgi:hypothetical protein